MKRKGIIFRRANRLGYRMADPTRDFDDRGDPIPSNFVIIVSMKNCEFYTKQKEDSLFPQTYYNPEKAPALFPHRHSQTNMIYGVKRSYKRAGAVYKVTTPVYWVEDGHVYQGTIVNADSDVEGYVDRSLIDLYRLEHMRNKIWKERMKEVEHARIN